MNALAVQKEAHANALAADATKAQNALRLEIYEDLAGASKEASEVLAALAGLYSSLRMDFSFATTLGRQRLDQERYTPTAIRGSHYGAMPKVLAVMATMEKWEIALGPDFLRFKEAFSTHMTQAGEWLTNFTEVATAFLPPMTVWPAAPTTLEKIDTLLDSLWNGIFDLICDLWDLRIACQNRLLGGLFEWRVPPRRPEHPQFTSTVLPEDEHA